MILTAERIWKDEELYELVSKMSINYKEPQEIIYNYPLREEFYKKARVDLFKKSGLSPEVLPTQSIILLGKPLLGKSLIMESWREFLKTETLKASNRIDDFYRDNENGHLAYNQELSKFSHAWICERDTIKYFNNFENDPDAYKRLVFKKYFFLDDLFFKKYDYLSGKKTTENFNNFQETLFRFLEVNKDIIVIASTNNYPEDILADAQNDTILTRFNSIFRETNRLIISEN